RCIDARAGRRTEPGTSLRIFELEIAGKDHAAFEPHALQRIDRAAAACFEILGDETLRVLSGSGNGRAAEQQRDRNGTHVHLNEPPNEDRRAWNRCRNESSSRAAVGRSDARVGGQGPGRSRNHFVTMYFVPRLTFIPWWRVAGL